MAQVIERLKARLSTVMVTAWVVQGVPVHELASRLVTVTCPVPVLVVAWSVLESLPRRASALTRTLFSKPTLML
jgi:hypothetical protein